MTAKVIWFNALRGYGFARAPGISLDILIRAVQLQPEVDCLQAGDIITCDLIRPAPEKPGSIRRYGPRAMNVELHPRRRWFGLL